MVLAAALGVWAFINGRFLFAGYHALVASARVRGLPLLPPPLSGERLLVLAPHPDDEVLAAGGLMGRVAREGGEVRVVSLTSGTPLTWRREARFLPQRPCAAWP